MNSPRHALRWAVCALVAATAVVVPSPTSPVASVQAAPGLGAGGEFFPLTPTRIYDSRPNEPAVNEPAPGPKAATPDQPTFDIPLLGQGGVPADSSRVLAVVVNITVTSPTASGWLNAFAAGSPPATATSIINFTKGQTVPNLAIVRPGTDGKLSIRLFSSAATGSADVIVDVFGWIATSANPDRGARLVPVTPGRIYDSRDGGSGIGQGQSIELPIRGATVGSTTVPNTADVVGVVLNVTGVNNGPGSVDTFVAVVPDPVVNRPGTSNLNLAKGLVKPNLVVVPVNAADGKVRLFNNTGTTNLAVDVVGYLERRPDETRAGRIVPLSAPFRVFDTREAAFGNVELGPGQAEPWSFADFVASVNIGGVAVGNQMAVIGNLTSASLRRQYASQAASSYVSVFPDQLPTGQRPATSNLNMVENVPVPNLAVVKYGASSTAWVYNFNGYAHYLFDASAVVLAD
jgi:hypothetical protein